MISNVINFMLFCKEVLRTNSNFRFEFDDSTLSILFVFFDVVFDVFKNENIFILKISSTRAFLFIITRLINMRAIEIKIKFCIDTLSIQNWKTINIIVLRTLRLTSFLKSNFSTIVFRIEVVDVLRIAMSNFNL